MSKSILKFLNIFVLISIHLSLLTGCGNIEAQETPVLTANQTSLPSQQVFENQNPNQEFWLDETIDTQQFSPTEDFIVHFKNPISLSSSSTPIFTWPHVDGISTWNEEGTKLTFKLSNPLDNKKIYTFFLDPELKYENGENIQSSTEWNIYVKNGPKVLNVIPAVGALDKLHKNIEIKFDRNMLDETDAIFTIHPNIEHEIFWKDSKTLQIILEEPLAIDQRYDLILKGENLFSEDGSYLSEDYSWFYWQNPLEISTTISESNKVVHFNFNYTIDKEKTGLPFSLSPLLKGEWSWISSQKLQFKSDEIIPSSIENELILNSPLIDISGFEIEKLPTTKFSGHEPFRLKMTGLEKNQYNDIFNAEAEIESLRIEFDFPVNHASAEKSFSITPAISGKFHWEKVGNTSKEILVFVFDELLSQSIVYTLRIDKSLLDSKNNKVITQDYQQKFQREYWSYINPSFGEYGDNIQVIDTNGSRKIQISGNHPDISFSAYSFDISEYASLYAQYYHFRSGNVVDIPIPNDVKPRLIWQNAETYKIGQNNYDNITETTVPPELLPGLYIVNLKVKNRLYDQLFLVISENTLVVKNDGDDLFVWLTNINGEVVENAEIRVYSSTGAKIREGTTDSRGQYSVSIPEGVIPSLVFAFVRNPGQPNDSIVAGVNTGTWGSYFPYDYEERNNNLPEGKPYLAYIYTERPIYRPNQTVNFKVILRKDDDLKYDMVEITSPIHIRIKDARDNTIASYEMLTNEFGTVNGSFNISEGAMLGLYTIETEINGIITRENFKVEDYKKPDYRLTITSLQPEKLNTFVQGEDVHVQVNASYFFGEPLTDTKLSVNFYIYWPVKTKVSGELTTDKDGNALFSFKAPYDETRNDYYYYEWYNNQNPQLVRMEVTANDGSNQVVAGVYHFQVHPASEKISFVNESYFFEPNKAFSIIVQDIDLFGQPIAEREISLSVHKWNRGSYEFDTASESFKLVTNSQGEAKQELKLTPGYYKLTLSSKDAEGHKIEYSRWIYIFRDRDDWVFTSRENQIQISVEKSSYQPYEKARFMIESTFNGPALITFERGSVINSKLIELTAPLTIFETDIIPEHAPNVYVTVNAWQPAVDENRDTWMTTSDSYLRIDKAQILVDASKKELVVDIITDKTVYEPGDIVSATINVKDSQGNPVLSELSLAVVDESIFSLSNEFEPNIFDAFYGPRAHTVSTLNSMAPYRIILSGGQGGGGDQPPLAARQDFLDTSTWLPVIYTDENGQSTVTFDLPDNTTSWRLTVKAITLEHQVGQAKINFETKKEVFLRPVLPRILTHGDQANLTAFLHNYSEEEKTIKVNLIADGLEIQGQNEEIITLKPNEVVPIGWRVIVNRATPTEITITAQESQNTLDIVKVPLLIQPEAVRDVQNQSGEFNGTVVLPLMLPEVDTETSHVLLSLNQSMSGTLLNGLEYLTGYPYGCVEQTMSRALPNAVVARASQQLGIGGPNLQNQVDPLVQASINKLYSLQHSDGGWGWWSDDISAEYQTAWVLFGLGILNNSGYPIEPRVLDDAANWLTNTYSYSSEYDIRTRAYSLYSLAMADRGNLEQTQKLVGESIYELDQFSQAALALALYKMGEEEKAQEILKLISQSAQKENELIYFPQASYDGEYRNKTMSSTIRTTAMVLLAYTKIDPSNELITGMVKYLTSKRQGIYGWGTTNETSFTILALTEYFISQENEQGETPYLVFLNDVKLFEGKLEVGNTNIVLEIPAEKLEHGKNDIRITTNDDSILYFDISSKYDLTQHNIEAAGNVKVTRRYLDPKTNQILDTITAGQVVKVEVSVTMSENTYYVAVEDYLPGGLEAINEGLNHESQVSYDIWGSENYHPFFWQDYGYNYKEIRGDKVVFFITTLEKGKQVFTYFARAITTGNFTALPTQVYAMYDSSIWGRSEKTEIEVK